MTVNIWIIPNKLGQPCEAFIVPDELLDDVRQCNGWLFVAKT